MFDLILFTLETVNGTYKDMCTCITISLYFWLFKFVKLMYFS